MTTSGTTLQPDERCVADIDDNELDRFWDNLARDDNIGLSPDQIEQEGNSWANATVRINNKFRKQLTEFLATKGKRIEGKLTLSNSREHFIAFVTEKCKSSKESFELKQGHTTGFSSINCCTLSAYRRSLKVAGEKFSEKEFRTLYEDVKRIARQFNIPLNNREIFVIERPVLSYIVRNMSVNTDIYDELR
jgi:hypothetical protein